MAPGKHHYPVLLLNRRLLLFDNITLAGLCLRCGTNIVVWARDSAEMRMVMEIRMEEHPIFGVQEKGREVIFSFDGQEIKGYEGEPIAVA